MTMLRCLLITLTAVFLAGCGTSSLDEVASPGRLAPEAAIAGDSAALQGAPNAVVKPAATGFQPVVASSEDRIKARKSVEAITAVATPGNEAYRIGPLDVIDVIVFKVPELSRTLQVSDTGTVSYPLIGQIQVAGTTAREIEEQLTKKLGEKYLQSPQVNVSVKEYNSQRITMDGAVKKPGIYPMQGGMTLLQAIAQANGLDTAADGELVVFRTTDGKRQVARFMLADVRGGTVPDPQLRAGDVVVAGTSAFKEAFNNVLKALPLASVFTLL